LFKSYLLASLASLDHPNPPLPTSTGSFATSTDLQDPATQQDHHPFDSACKESDNNTSDPDPRCLDLDLSSQDSNAGTQLEDSSLPNLESVFENTCLKNLLTAIEFIQALQSASHNNIYCKMDQNAIQRLRNPPTTPFNISSLSDLFLGLDLFLTNMDSFIEFFNAN
jgi:hypothetical protein